MPLIAVTGATGFIGRRVIAGLYDHFGKARFRLLVRNRVHDRARLGILDAEPDHCASRIEVVDGTLSDPAALERLVADADAVIHIAGAIAGNCPADFDTVNVAGTRRLAEALARRAPEAHLVLISSLAARHPELSWYAASKLHGEEVVKTRLANWSILRPPAVYGPQDPALASFWRALARGWLLRLGPAAARFSLLDVDDLAEAARRLIDSGPTRVSMPLAGPQPDGGWSWPALARLAAARRGKPIRTVTIPAPLLKLLGHAGPVYGRLSGRAAMLNPGKVRELHHDDWVCDNVAIEAALDWRPRRTLERILPTLPGWSH